MISAPWYYLEPIRVMYRCFSLPNDEPVVSRAVPRRAVCPIGHAQMRVTDERRPEA